MTVSREKTKPFFGLTGGWLTFWVTVSCCQYILTADELTMFSGQVACATDMTLFGYDQGVFSKSNEKF